MFLVGIEAQSKIRTKEHPEPRLWQSVHKHDKVKTMNSDTRSIGYETMTTLSDQVSRTNI